MKKNTTKLFADAIVFIIGLYLAYRILLLWFGFKIAFTVVGGFLALKFILQTFIKIEP